MGNTCKKPRQSQYAVLKTNGTEPDMKVLPKPIKVPPPIQYESEVPKHMPIRLSSALSKLPARMRSFTVGMLIHGRRIRDVDMAVEKEEFRQMWRRIEKHLRVSRAKPIGQLNFQPRSIKQLKDNELLSYGTMVSRNLKDCTEFSISGFMSAEQTITEAGFLTFISKIVRSLTKLKKLTLILSDNQAITDSMLRSISIEVSRNLINLKHLKISIQRCQSVSPAGPGLFLSGVNRYLPGLVSLELSIINEITQLREISGYFDRGLRNLKKLTLKVFNRTASVTDKTLEDFGSDISKYLKNLRSLALTFSSMTEMTGKSVEMFLAEVCGNLPKLNSFSLFVPGCTNIKNYKPSKKPTKNQAAYMHLTDLYLNFSGCTQLTDGLMDHLTEWIKIILPHLKVYQLNITGCPQVTRAREERMWGDLSFVEDLEIISNFNKL